jgi:two-component system, NarL family, sensor histidine kinase UhpB
LTWLRNIGWAALAIATLATAVAPELVTLPEPESALVLDQATYLPDNGSGSEVSLPHAIYPRINQHPNLVRYLIGFDLSAKPDQNLFLFIPSINRRISLLFNGETLFGFESSAFWTGPLASTSVMVQLPRLAMNAGRNQLTVVVESGPFAVPTYLSKIYVGSEAALASPYKLRIFLDSQLKIMALAAHVILGLGLICAYFFRPKDPLFFWLATFNVVSVIVATGVLGGYQPALQGILPFIVAVSSAMGFIFVIVALALINVHPPKVLGFIAMAVPCVLLPFALIDTTLSKMILAGSAVAVLITGYIAGTGLLAWGAFRLSSTDARLMLPPSFLIAWFAIRDVYVTVTLPEHAFNLLTTYPRPLYLAFITAVLMRRMGVSLDQVDRANETLNIKLAEQQAEFAALHRQERAKTANLVREQERQRLTHDLHDGISGHLVSIIALSERAGDKPIEQAAREALNDLRLVIYSLDLGDRELPLALANFRERLIPQLHRLGVELDWSIAGLPEVSGVTPGNALAVLRILQEAITNALKHGPARKITIRGAPSADGMVAITLENDGRAFVENGGGHGLANMRRRAQQLHGKLNIEAVTQGTKITLLLPSRLPDFEDEAVA